MLKASQIINISWIYHEYHTLRKSFEQPGAAAAGGGGGGGSNAPPFCKGARTVLCGGGYAGGIGTYHNKGCRSISYLLISVYKSLLRIYRFPVLPSKNPSTAANMPQLKYGATKKL